MLAWLLRAMLAAEVLGAVWLRLSIFAEGGVAATIGCAVGVLVGVPSLLLAAAYAIAAANASPRPAGVAATTVRDGLVEWAWFLAGFGAIMPFPRAWMGSEAIGRLPAGRRPVLLVHGYMCNGAFWWWMRRRLRARGFAVATVDLEGPFADIEDLAAGLDARIDALLAETGSDRVLLVTHSMGGLVARASMRARGTGRIARFVTLGGPHHGTVSARLGLGRNARQMEPGNPWLAELNRVETTDVPTLTIWSCGDEIVAPQATSRLAGADETVLGGFGHMAMAFSTRVEALVAADLARDR